MLQPYNAIIPGLYQFPLNFNGVIEQGVHPDKQKAQILVPYPEVGKVRIRTDPRWALDDAGLAPLFSAEKDALLARILVYTYLIGVGTQHRWTVNYRGPSLTEPLLPGYWLAATTGRIQEDSQGQVNSPKMEVDLDELMSENVLTRFDLPSGPAYGPSTELIIKLVSSRDVYAGQPFYKQKIRNLQTF
ncbi:MAG: hypothetical protein KAZ30_01870 [Candidatus Magasanikbacteria bacterium]|nr:hypothetical protein [Candidatus Magasanikbacteria bacterium]